MFLKNQTSAFFAEIKILMKNVPPLMFTFFVISIIGMNLLANKSLDTGLSWLALDCGFLLSWVAFLTMDIMTKRFGPKAATQISVIALLINLAFAGLMYAGSLVPGTWGEAYIAGHEAYITAALDNTFGGTWYIILGSSVAFLSSAFLNNFLNWKIGCFFSKMPDSFKIFAARAYISTFIAQFADNLIFALIVSRTFFHWSMLQCITCAITGATAELLCEVIFSPVGYNVSKKWQKEKVGQDYIDFIAQTRSCGA